MAFSRFPAFVWEGQIESLAAEFAAVRLEGSDAAYSSLALRTEDFF